MRSSSSLSLGLLVITIAVLPLFLPNSFYVEVAVLFIVNAIVCIGLNLLFGYAGQISLGHAGFFGMGAYGAALGTQYGLPSLIAIIGSAVCVGFLAYLIGRPMLRLSGHYLAMATLGVGIVIWTVFSREIELTGGPDGMPVAALSIGDVKIHDQMTWYWILALLLVLTAALAQSFVNSPPGRALRALNGSEVAASLSGIDVIHYKVLIFVISAVIASIAGSLFAHYAQFISPEEASFIRSIEFVTMVVLGGMASIPGAIVGAAILTTLPYVFSALHDFEMILLGGVLVLCMVLMPRGLVPSLSTHVVTRAKLIWAT